MDLAHESPVDNPAGRGLSTRQDSRRRLASSAELVASLTEAADRCAASGSWTDVRVLRLQFSEQQGDIAVPASACYSAAVFTGSAPRIHATDSLRTLPAVEPYAGSALFHGRGLGLRYVWSAQHCTDWVCLEPQLVAAVAEHCGLSRIELPGLSATIQQGDATCEHLVGALVQEVERDAHAAQQMTVESIANALACRLVTRLGAQVLRPVAPAGALGMRHFRMVREYIDEHLGERICLEDLASIAGVSRFHFARQFRLRTGESPMAYLLRARVERAKNLLSTSSSRIADIAAVLGFADQSHFTRTFKRLTDVPPSVFATQRRARRYKTGREHSIPRDVLQA